MTNVQHIFYAEDALSAARIMDNAISAGADEVRAELDKDAGVYKVEYRTEQTEVGENVET